MIYKSHLMSLSMTAFSASRHTCSTKRRPLSRLCCASACEYRRFLGSRSASAAASPESSSPFVSFLASPADGDDTVLTSLSDTVVEASLILTTSLDLAPFAVTLLV